MPAHPMSFADVLQDEYRYFFGEVPLYDTIVELREEHVRELANFANKLLLAREQNVKSRWRLLGQRAFDAGVPKDRGAAVLAALNAMLTDPQLLHTLLDTEEEGVSSELGAPRALHALLAVPIARRLVLQEKSMRAAILDDDGVLPRFATKSAAVRLLIRDGASELLLHYPALLSTITDDSRVETALAESVDTRRVLRRLYEQPSSQAPWYSPRRLFRRITRDPKEEVGLHDVAADPGKLLAMIGATETIEPSQAIPPEELSHFNALVLETVYGDYVSDGVTMRELYRALHRKQTSALCLSGGGIRSATFNLGILQGLADHRMLNRFNYISTVSGGGYIGSWLSSWMRRHNDGTLGVAQDLVREPIDPLEPEVQPIRHLREYSSYLAPRSSAFSVDSWTLLATYLRNLLLNWTMLLPFLAAILVLPRLMEALLSINMISTSPLPGVAATLAAVFGVLMVGAVRPNSDITAKKKIVGRRPLRDAYNDYLKWLGPLLLSAVLFSIYWAEPYNLFQLNAWVLPALFMIGSVLSAIVYVMRRAAAASAASNAPRWRKIVTALRALANWKEQRRQLYRECLAAALAGTFGGWLLYTLFNNIFPPERLTDTLALETYACTAVPLYLLVFFAKATLVVGLTTKSSSDHDREWWARSAATMFLAGISLLALSLTVIILPMLILQLPEFLAPFGGASAVASWLLQKQLKRRDVKKEGSSKSLMRALHIAAAVTMAFVLALLSLASSYLLWRLLGSGTAHTIATAFGKPVTPATARFISVLRESPWTLVIAFGSAATELALIMSWLLDVNLYSMHAMYRNRLVRAYLGAARWSRNPDAFTGFDPQDDVRMADLRPEALWPSCIVNFDAFLAKLMAEPKLLGQLPDNVQQRVRAFVNLRGAGDDRESLKAAVVNALNELMPTRDLEHDIEAPPSLELFLHNRKYLDGCFDGALKAFAEAVDLPDSPGEVVPFDDDDAPLQLRRELSDGSYHPVRGRPPLHIVNAALNLVSGSNLAWQERKAASFTISPLHSGSRLLCYRDSAVYAGGVTLGTALAISGAAVSPNMGSMSSPTFTFLMTLFNARLGWWLGNPSKNEYELVSPTSSITSLLREAGGRTDESHPFVFLSDGGHFENLGVYEMVARRCKYIMVCDATADGDYAFGDLANAVRKIRIDMGIPIEPLTTQYIEPEAGERHGKYCAMGEIRYQDVDGGDALGYLLYIKPAVREDCPADVRNYRRESTTFPHESTADQFFSESQFESYRALGRHILGEICGTGVHRGHWITPNVAAFFGKAYAYINKLEPGIGDRPVKTMKDVVGWMRDGI